MNQAIDNSSNEFKRVNKGNKGRFFQKDYLSQFFIFTYASQKKTYNRKIYYNLFRHEKCEFSKQIFRIFGLQFN